MKSTLKVRQLLRSIAGIKDRVNTKDRLDIRMEAAPKVLCVCCGAHIYYLKEGAHGERAFAPTGLHEVREDMICPACGGYLCAYAGKQPIIKTDGGWV